MELPWQRLLHVAVCLIAVSKFSSGLYINRPDYVECVDSAECGRSHCCTIGMGRFTVPTCRPFLDYRDQCRPAGARPENLNLTYPDGTFIALTQVYRIMCPCGFGLECSEDTGTCVDPSMSDIFNDINYY